MAIETRREGFIDYLLAGLAGATGGLRTGLEKRKATELEQARQDAIRQLQKEQLELQKQAQLQRQAFNMINLREQRKAREDQQKFQERLLGLQTGAKKDIIEFEQEVKQGKTGIFERLFGMPSSDALDALNTMSLIQNRQSEIEARELRNKIALAQEKRAEERWTWDQEQADVARRDAYAKMNFNVQNQRAMARYNAVVDQLARRDFTPLQAKNYMQRLDFLWYTSMVDPDADTEDKKAAASEHKRLSKDFSRWLKKHMNIEYEPVDIDWQDAWYNVLPGVSGGQAVITEKEEAVGGETPQQQTAVEKARARIPLPIPIKITPSPEGGGIIETESPKERQRQGGPSPSTGTEGSALGPPYPTGGNIQPPPTGVKGSTYGPPAPVRRGGLRSDELAAPSVFEQPLGPPRPAQTFEEIPRGGISRIILRDTAVELRNAGITELNDAHKQALREAGASKEQIDYIEAFISE